MRRNNSYSLQKVNPNVNSNRNYSRIQGAPKTRVSFPVIGDSGFYGGVGRKHYQKSTQFIHKLILNPNYGKQQNLIPRVNSQSYLKKSPQSTINIQNKSPQKIQINMEKDSLNKLQQQLSKKLSTQFSPQKTQKNGQNHNLISPKTEIIGKKSSLYDPYSGYEKNSSHFKLFGGVDNYYEAIHTLSNDITSNSASYANINKVTNQQSQLHRRRLNPTYLSTSLGIV